MIFERLGAAAPEPRAEEAANKRLVLRVTRDCRCLQQRSNADALAKPPHAKRIGKKVAGGAANLIDHAGNLISIL